MPVMLNTRPEPGGLITADTMLSLIQAIETLQSQMEAVLRRLAIVEQGGFRKDPHLVPINPGKFTEFIKKVRGGDIKILEEKDKLARLEKIAELYQADRDDFFIDEVERRELSPEDWIVAGTAAGVKPSQIAIILQDKYPTTAAAIDTKLGDQASELDSYANLETGTIGFLR